VHGSNHIGDVHCFIYLFMVPNALLQEWGFTVAGKHTYAREKSKFLLSGKSTTTKKVPSLF
jgi:hypothetical protein